MSRLKVLMSNKGINALISKREFLTVKNDGHDFYEIDEDQKNYLSFNIKLYGEENTPYENGIFLLNFRYDPITLDPSVKFITRIYHPNFDNVNNIIIKNKTTFFNILGYIRKLMKEPDLTNNINKKITDEYKNNHEKFIVNAKEFTKRFAK
jgi:ubiquitin-protein ligase